MGGKLAAPQGAISVVFMAFRTEVNSDTPTDTPFFTPFILKPIEFYLRWRSMFYLFALVIIYLYLRAAINA
jgi:hypothetical protein